MPDALPTTPSAPEAATGGPADGEADLFAALVGASARDPVVRCYFANLLEAQPISAEEKDAIWRSFTRAAATANPSVTRASSDE